MIARSKLLRLGLPVLVPLLVGVATGGSAGAESNRSAAVPASPTTAASLIQRAGYMTMSDGTKLRYTAVLPAATGRFPVALKYDGYCEGTSPMTCNEGDDAKALLAAGYAVLGVNLRGTGCSEGTFDFRSPIETTDGVAVVEWAARQSWSTGHVGMFGDSFPGITQPQIAAMHPTGLDAIAPWQIVDDVYRDAAYPGGLPNGEFGILWGIADQPNAATSSIVAGLEAGDTQCGRSLASQLPANPLNNILVAGFSHPYEDGYWASKTVGAAADKITVPAFGCASWQDDEVSSRSTATLWPRLDPSRTWVIGTNGFHGMCVYSNSITNQLVRFFDRYVKGERNGFESTPHVQVWHETTNAAEPEPGWVTTSKSWPPATTTERLYLGNGGALSSAAPKGTQVADTYLSPTISAGTEDGAIAGQHNLLWKVPGTPFGAVAYTTPKLGHDTEALGPMSVDLWLASTATDTDVQATVTEVRPDGQEVYVGRGWLRASMRKLDPNATTATMPVQTFRQADVQPLVPGQAVAMRISVPPFDHVFRAGSQIRIVIDTPSQTGGWNFEPALNAGLNSIVHDAAHPSAIVFGTIVDLSIPDGVPACDTVLNQPCRRDAFTTSAPASLLR